jgi:hypothetical protein
MTMQDDRSLGTAVPGAQERPPSTPSLYVSIAALVAQWRLETGGSDHDDQHDPAAAYLAGVDRCADELAKLLGI